MALRMLVYAGLLWQTWAASRPKRRARLPLALLVVVYTGPGRWRPKTLRELLRETPAGLRARSPECGLETLDAGTLTADDGRNNWLAALLRLLRCRDAGKLPELSRTLFDGLRRDGLEDLAQRLAELVMRMLLVRFGREQDWGPGSYLDQALRYMEEPTMLERAITEWRNAALAGPKPRPCYAWLRQLAATGSASTGDSGWRGALELLHGGVLERSEPRSARADSAPLGRPHGSFSCSIAPAPSRRRTGRTSSAEPYLRGPSRVLRTALRPARRVARSTARRFADGRGTSGHDSSGFPGRFVRPRCAKVPTKGERSARANRPCGT